MLCLYLCLFYAGLDFIVFSIFFDLGDATGRAFRSGGLRRSCCLAHSLLVIYCVLRCRGMGRRVNLGRCG